MYRMTDLNDQHGGVTNILAVAAIAQTTTQEVGVIEFGPDSRLADDLLERLKGDVSILPFLNVAATFTGFFGKERIANAFPSEEPEAEAAAPEAGVEESEQTDQQGGGEAVEATDQQAGAETADEVTGPQAKAYAVLVDGVVEHLFLVTGDIVVTDELSGLADGHGDYIFGFTSEELSEGPEALRVGLAAVYADDYLYRIVEGAKDADPQNALDVFETDEVDHREEFDHEGVTYSVIYMG